MFELRRTVRPTAAIVALFDHRRFQHVHADGKVERRGGSGEGSRWSVIFLTCVVRPHLKPRRRVCLERVAVSTPLTCDEVGAESRRQQRKHPAVDSSTVVAADVESGHHRGRRRTPDLLGVLDAADRVAAGRHGQGQRRRCRRQRGDWWSGDPGACHAACRPRTAWSSSSRDDFEVAAAVHRNAAVFVQYRSSRVGRILPQMNLYTCKHSITLQLLKQTTVYVCDISVSLILFHVLFSTTYFLVNINILSGT